VDGNKHKLQDLLLGEPGPAMLNAERREWWLWSSAVLITLLLTAGITSFVLPSVLAPWGMSDTFSLNQVVGGLIGLVLVFDLYVVYEQHQINVIRRQMTDQLYRLSVIDPLTGLFNRRHIEQKLADEIARSERHGHPLTVILFDLDSFKRVNDTHGHPAGDCVLRAFADRLRKATRGSDVAGRYGGDEFLIILPECRGEGVQYVFNRLNELAVEVEGSTLPVLYSAGWANYLTGETLIELLTRADDALYVSKRGPAAPPAPTSDSDARETAATVQRSPED
jgi:diguanylate cyclase (GGDEF)-like protein